jgi:hypothetical protein
MNIIHQAKEQRNQIQFNEFSLILGLYFFWQVESVKQNYMKQQRWAVSYNDLS